MRASHSTSKHLLCHTVPASHRCFVRQSGGVFLRLDQWLCGLRRQLQFSGSFLPSHTWCWLWCCRTRMRNARSSMRKARKSRCDVHWSDRRHLRCTWTWRVSIRVCMIQRMGGLTRDFMMDVVMGLLYFGFRQTSPTEQSMPIMFFVPWLWDTRLEELELWCAVYIAH